MTLKVVFRRAEFDGAALWYEERQPGLGMQFTSEIDRAVNLAAENPERFPIKHGDIRCVQTRRFPYSVFYRIDSSSNRSTRGLPCTARSGHLANTRITARSTATLGKRRSARALVRVIADVGRYS